MLCCNGSCKRVIGTCVTCVTCAGRATMTRKGGGIWKCAAARAVPVSSFYQVPKKWMHTPMSGAPRHPSRQSAKTVVPNFSGKRSSDKARGKQLITQHTNTVVGEAKAPTFTEFATAMRRSPGKGAAADSIPKGVWQPLPYKKKVNSFDATVRRPWNKCLGSN